MKKEIVRKSAIWITLICWLIFICLHTFTRITCFSEHKSVWAYLISAIITLACTFLYIVFYWDVKTIFSDSAYLDICDDELFEDYVFDPTEDEKKKNTRLQHSLLTLFILSTLFLTALVMEAWVVDFTFFTDKTYISIGRLTINKKYLYDPFLFIVFPLFVQMIFQGMTEEHYNWKSIVSGAFQIISLSLMGFLLFMRMPNIWLIELAIICLITIIIALWKYTWKNIKHKKNTIIFILLYAGFWIGLLGLSDFSRYSFVQYTFGNNWNYYVECVQTLLKNVSFFGTSSELQSNAMIQEFLMNHSNYLHSVLYHFGWSAAIPLIGFLIAFLIATKVLLGKNGEVHINYLVYQAAWWTVALRIIIGIPYSFALLPIPIGLPFASSLSICMDTIAIGLMLWCAWEDKKIEHLHSYAPVKAEKYVADAENIIVTETDSTTLYEMPMKGFQEDDEDELKKYSFWNDDKVICKSGDLETPCNVRWYGYSTRKFAVFEPVDEHILEFFILEHLPDTGKWILVNDERLYNLVSYAYFQRYVPNCYEDMNDLI